MEQFIVNGNKKLALFLGYKSDTYGGAWIKFGMTLAKSSDDLDFHKNWNNLFKVLAKIKESGKTWTITDKQFIIKGYFNYPSIKKTINTQFGHQMMVWEGCLDYIDSLNKK
jgi:hypothetical protein